MAGVISILGYQTPPDGERRRIGPVNIDGGDADFSEVQWVALSSGDNTITIDSEATACVIEPPSDNTQTITLKGDAGDTGVALDPAQPTVLSFADTPPSSIILNAGGAVDPVVITFI